MNNPIQSKLEIPLWATSRKFRPAEYVRLVDEVRRSDGLMCTEKVCTLLMKTGLRREFLGYIWSTANRHTPGVLNEQEFCIILALVALAQKGTPTFDLSLLTHLHEPPIPIFDRKFTLKQDNIRLQNTGSNSHQFAPCSSLNNSGMGDSKNAEDEYSDFQCAPVPTAISNSNVQVGNVNSKHIFGKSTGTASINSSISLSAATFDSPVHAIANFPKNPSLVPVNSCQVPKSVSESSVGSRLANYDLGMSSSTTPVTHTGSTTNENLMIGEVDKYSALRDLVSVEPVLTNTNSNPMPNGRDEDLSFNQAQQNNSVQNDSSVFSDDILQVVKTESADISSDFGDFQSFSNTNTRSSFESPESGKTRNPVDVFSDSASVWKHHGISNFETSSPQLPNISSSVYISNSVSNSKRSNFSDGEFGDFVSCTNGVFNTEVPDTGVQNRMACNIRFDNSKLESSSKSRLQENQTVPKLSLNIASKAASPVQKKSGSDRISSKTNTFHLSTQKSPKVELTTIPDLNLNANDDISFPNDSDFDISDIKFDMIGPLKTPNVVTDDFFDSDSVGYQINLDAINTQDFDCVHPIKTKFSETSPETRSLASLDFGNYNTTWDLSDTTKPSVEATGGLNLESKNFKGDMNYPVSSPSSPSLNSKYFNNNTGASTSQQSVDKYQCFKEEIENETERYSFEWIRCMRCCFSIISYAMNVFNSASSSAVIRDVVCNEKGQTYILNLIEVYLVASRIQRSWLKLGGDSKVGQIHHEIVEAWDSLTPFLLGTPLMEDISSADEWLEGEYSDYSKVCGVCLINTMKDDPNALLDYGGKHYHATCANLWINGVDSILPSLSYVSLL